ncbi:MAG: ABC transporter permease [Oscillospiraceae bacterium]|nr:ABC transporter permease [Oscillospiraceae bacterium]
MNNFPDFPDEKFRFVKRDEEIQDTAFETKQVGYFRDAMRRFKKNKSSVAAAIIIILLILFAILTPIFSTYNMGFTDSYYTFTRPKCTLLSGLGIWDGTSNRTVNQQTYDYYDAAGAVLEVKDVYEVTDSGRTTTYYDVKIDDYLAVGYEYINLTRSEYEAALAYEKETGKQLFYPMVNLNEVQQESNAVDANYWFEHNQRGVAKRDSDGNYIPIYKTDEASVDGLAYYTMKMNGNQYQVRVYYYDWFTYKNGQAPAFLFGTDYMGHDILSRLASGARFSLMLSVIVSAINFIIGTIYGAIEGYYGGKADLIMERIADVLYSVPYMVLFSLLQLRWGKEIGVVGALLLAFVLTGWIGVASTVRTQFYRFKGQEYVLAARTLGAKDGRLIARHILPNALGTIVTSCVLMVPGVIFTESSLSYLGVLNLDSSTLTSVGTMLSTAQSALSTYPHAIFFPALFISLMMISFNLFGNGLRDALNPTLRGADE